MADEAQPQQTQQQDKKPYQKMGGYNNSRPPRQYNNKYNKNKSPADQQADSASDSKIQQMFAGYAAELDADNDCKERIYKAARDVTIQSKRVIFTLHRYKLHQNTMKKAMEKLVTAPVEPSQNETAADGDDIVNPYEKHNSEVFQQAEQALQQIQVDLKKIADEVSANEVNYWRYWSRFTLYVFGFKKLCFAFDLVISNSLIIVNTLIIAVL